MAAQKRRMASEASGASSSRRPRVSAMDPADIFALVLADADCTLLGGDVPILGSGHVTNLQMQLQRSLESDQNLGDKFITGLQTHIDDEVSLRRLLKPISNSNGGYVRESLARVLLTVPCIQAQVANILLEKLPEYFSYNDSMTPFTDSLPRLILAQFRWLEYLVDSSSVTQRLLQVLSIAPLNLKKEMIGFLPEVVSDGEHETVMTSLEQMLQEDLQIIVPVLDALSNLNLDKALYEKVIDIALTSLRSADAEDLPLLVKFLLQSTTSENARRIIHHLRESLNFVSLIDVRGSKPDRKLKGKSTAGNCEALVLEALRSGLRFQSAISDECLKEIKSVQKERNHKIVDIWLLLIIHANGGTHRKSAESLLKRKVVNREIGSAVTRQAIKGHGDSLQDYFHALISVAGFMLRSKERLCLHFGMNLYILLFEEFGGTYHRQEILGCLITHTGTGIADEVSTALKTLVTLAESFPRDMIPISSYINVILDYLETFPMEDLHQVYKIFSQLAMACWSSRSTVGRSSVADELLIFIRKQVANPELKYKHMGIIGVVNLMSCLEVENDQGLAAEAINLLQMTLDMCKHSEVARGFFYDELANHLETQVRHATILEWCSKHTSEFESTFLGDLEEGRLASGCSTSKGACEGELWMNLDDNASPVFVNIMPMLMSADPSVSNCLLFLLPNFRVLAATERSINQGSMGSIDALLGCPVYLPKAELFCGSSWTKLPKRQKELSCISIFYAINWIKELINAFTVEDLSTLEDDMAEKLINRVRHVLSLEQLLVGCLKAVPSLVFPQIHCLCVKQEYDAGPLQPGPGPRSKKRKVDTGRQKNEKPSQDSQTSQAGGKLRQRTIFSAFGKLEESHPQSQNANQSEENANKNNEEQPTVNIASSEDTSFSELLGGKLRPLNVTSLSLLGTSKPVKTSCCSDPQAKLPVYLYLMKDMLIKLESYAKKTGPLRVSTKTPSGLGSLSPTDFLNKLTKLLPNMRLNIDTAVSVLEEQDVPAKCSSHWLDNAGTPILQFAPSRAGTAKSLLFVTFRCLLKILEFTEIRTLDSFVKDFLNAFASHVNIVQIFPGLQVTASADSLSYLSCSTYAYFDELFQTAVRVSSSVATELVMLLNSLVELLKSLAESTEQLAEAVLSSISQKLSESASRLLEREWVEEEGKMWKHDVLQRLLRIMIQQSRSPIGILEDLSRNVLTQVPTKGAKYSIPGYPALGPTTFLIWYRVQHEVVLDIFKKLVKKILACSKLKSAGDGASTLLDSTFRCITVHVSLINITRAQDKTAIHAVALRYGGKFVDTFLKALDFLEAHYDNHKGVINDMVREMQKATRTMQSICSEGKGQKKLPLTCKVPAVKRSMERYVFSIKALLHRVSNGTAFWMGNLKHKDLQGNEIGSQVPVDEEEEDNAVTETREEDERVEPDDDEMEDQEISLGDDA